MYVGSLLGKKKCDMSMSGFHCPLREIWMSKTGSVLTHCSAIANLDYCPGKPSYLHFYLRSAQIIMVFLRESQSVAVVKHTHSHSSTLGLIPGSIGYFLLSWLWLLGNLAKINKLWCFSSVNDLISNNSQFSNLHGLAHEM